MSSEDVRALKQVVFERLLKEFEPRLREKLNEIAITIACTSFPAHFEESLAYSEQVLGQLANDMRQGVLSCSVVSCELLDTTRKIFKACAQRGVLAGTEYFKTLVSRIYPAMISLWMEFSGRLSTGLSKLEVIVLRFNYILDGIFIYSLRAGTPESLNGDPDLRDCIKRLVEKSEAYMVVYRAEEKVIMQDMDRSEICEKIGIGLTYQLVFVMNLAPLAFGPVIEQYLKLNLGISLVGWASLQIKKAALLSLYRTLRLQIHFSSKGLHMSKAPKELQEISVDANSSFSRVMNKENMERLFSELVSKSMVLEEEGRSENIETLIEDEEPDGVDNSTDELDCALRKISLTLIEQLCLNFAPEAFKLIHGLAEALVSGSHSFDIRTQDSIISILSLLPNLYLRESLPKPQRLDGISLLRWMGEKGTGLVFFSRRFPMVLRMWLELIDYETARQVERF